MMVNSRLFILLLALAFAQLHYGQSEINTEKITITNGATNNYILKSDAQGNASWADPVSLLGGGSSHWTLNGTNLYNINTNNVGIGIQTPTTKLDVDGSVRSANSFIANGRTPIADFWSVNGISLQTTYGVIGTNGSFRDSWMWNGYRNSAGGWTSLGTNNLESAAAIELGNTGILFRTSSVLPTSIAPPARMLISADGNVGIATTSPNATLDVNGTVHTGLIETNSDRIELNRLGAGDRGAFIDYHASDDPSQADFSARVRRLPGIDGDFRVENRGTGNLAFRTSNINRALVKQDGKFLIGHQLTETPGNYLLYVEDGILTERVKIATIGTADWADYVFEEDYDLHTLEEVADFVKENKHLPNVPSALDIHEQGYELQKMDARLLEKIEELYLLTIQLNEEKKELKKENQILKTFLEESNQSFQRNLDAIQLRLNKLENK